MSDFEIVDPEKSAELKARHVGKMGRPKAAWTLAVESGETVRFRDRTHQGFGGAYAAFKARGLSLRTTNDGEGGVYVWAEPLK